MPEQPRFLRNILDAMSSRFRDRSGQVDKGGIELEPLELIVTDGLERRRLSIEELSVADNVLMAIRGKVGHKPFDILPEVIGVVTTEAAMSITLLMRSSEDLNDRETWDAVRRLSDMTAAKQNIHVGVVNLDMNPKLNKSR